MISVHTGSYAVFSMWLGSRDRHIHNTLSFYLIRYALNFTHTITSCAWDCALINGSSAQLKKVSKKFLRVDWPCPPLRRNLPSPWAPHPALTAQSVPVASWQLRCLLPPPGLGGERQQDPSDQTVGGDLGYSKEEGQRNHFIQTYNLLSLCRPLSHNMDCMSIYGIPNMDCMSILGIPFWTAVIYGDDE